MLEAKCNYRVAEVLSAVDVMRRLNQGEGGARRWGLGVRIHTRDWDSDVRHGCAQCRRFGSGGGGSSGGGESRGLQPSVCIQFCFEASILAMLQLHYYAFAGASPEGALTVTGDEDSSFQRALKVGLRVNPGG